MKEEEDEWKHDFKKKKVYRKCVRISQILTQG